MLQQIPARRSGDRGEADWSKESTSPQPSAPAPVFGGVNRKAEEQAELFAARLRKRARHFRRWPTKKEIHCFRLYDRDVPEIPLVVERFEDHLHLTEYERPHDRDVAQHADWLDLMKRTAAAALDVDIKRVFLKQKLPQRGRQQHEKAADRGYELTVREGGLQFLVNLSDYVDVGLFLDHRQTRAMVRERAKGKHVLNLFAYTGAFSVYAADGSAATVTTVDLSPTYLDWAQRNFELNRLRGDRYKFVQGDARSFFDDHPMDRYDLAVVDPPTFSNSKRTDSEWSVQRDHPQLLELVASRLNPGGTIVFSTNFRRFKLFEDELPPLQVHEISRQTVPEDFRNRRIHRCWLMQKE